MITSGPNLSRRGFLAGAAAGAALAALPALGVGGAEQSRRLAELFERSFARRLRRSPLLQATLGLNTDHHRWDDVGAQHRQEDIDLLRGDLAELRAIDPSPLPQAARLDHCLFRYDTEQALRRLHWRSHHYPVCQMRGPQRTVPQTLIDRHPIASRADAQAYIERLRGVDGYMRQVVDGLREQQAAGICPPASTLAPVVDTCTRLLRGTPFDGEGDNAILVDFDAKLAAAGLEGADALRRDAVAAMQDGFAPGFRRLIAWLQAAQGDAPSTAGVWSLPQGDAYYAAMLRTESTLTLDPDRVHAIGLEETARLHDEIRTLAPRLGHRDTLRELIERARSDPDARYPDTDAGRSDYLAAAEAVIEAVSARLDALTGFRPPARVGVRRVEPWLEVSAGIAGYFPPSQDGSRPGIVRYNLRDMGNLPRHELTALACHEGVPGHHLERSVSASLQNLPDFRRHGGYTAFSEGWALYAEQLPVDLGLYEDPWQDLGRLSSELMRAGRLVVDTGLHARRWSPQRALRWLDDNTFDAAPANAIAVRRYLVTPGQATAYQLGKRSLVELQARARRELGTAFRLRDFNDALLGEGPLPLPLLEERTGQWITNGAEGRSA
ncbi:DUF885 domain-containing protein [Luteimonas salinilitoris]|uniref:DUF885 family protein n=1 Tax=Luteimonas salinilitoris TaxID=3237697 RepID=A0ABV4HPT1_9GAMM